MTSGKSKPGAKASGIFGKICRALESAAIAGSCGQTS
jgi:hypothetical protein